LQLPNRYRSLIRGTARSLVYGAGASQTVPIPGESGAPGERSGSRGQLDASFRRVTTVGSPQTSLRRSVSVLRPGEA
jgi:hypothetical protein